MEQEVTSSNDKVDTAMKSIEGMIYIHVIYVYIDCGLICTCM